MVRIAAIFFLLLSQVYADTGGDKWREQLVTEFIESQKGKTVVDGNDYLIADSLQDTRRTWLLNRLKKKHAVYYAGETEHAIISSKSIGGASVALIAVTSSSDPFYEDAFALGFCRVGDEWKVTPITGAFVFTGYGMYQSDVLAELEELETWAASAQREYLRGRLSLREREYRATISKLRAEREHLLGANKEEVLLYFLEACREKNALAALACVDDGSVSKLVRQSIVAAFNDDEMKGLWNTLIREQYLLAVLPEIEGSSLVSLGLYLPHDKKHTQQIVEFTLEKTGDEWFLELPHALEMDSDGEFLDEMFRASNLHSENQSRLLEVQKRIIENIEFSRVESSNAIVTRFEQAVGNNDIEAFVQLVAPEQRGKHFNLSLWKKLTDESVSKMTRIYEDYTTTDAHVIYLVENWPRPERFSLVSVRFVKDESLWHVDPSKYSKRQMESVLGQEALEKYRDFNLNSDRHVLRALLPSAVEVNENKLQKVGGKDALRSVFKEYEYQLGKGDLKLLSRSIATTESEALSALRAIGSDARGRLRDDCVFEWVQAITHQNVAIAIVSLDYGDSTAKEYLFYPFVLLEGEVRLVPSLLYYFEHGRGQALENRKTFKLLEEAQLDGFKDEYFQAVKLGNAEVERILVKDKSNE